MNLATQKQKIKLKIMKSNFKNNESAPCAKILVKNDKTNALDEMKIYNDGIIYLKSGSEFVIKIYNPTQFKIGAQIIINGNESKSLIVLNPAEDIKLKRFIDDNKKMIFETYKYDASNKGAEQAVQNNGTITVKFFKEQITRVGLWNCGYSNGTFNLKNSGTSNGVFYPNTLSGITYTDSNIIGTNCTYTSNICDTGSNVLGGSFGGNNESPIFGNSSIVGSTFSSSTTNTVTFDSLLSTDSNTKSNENIKETGRVEKGGKSSQEFKTVNIDFETTPFHKVEYKLKPNSEKQEGIRLYCTECGRKIKEKFNFCPTCGTKAE